MTVITGEAGHLGARLTTPSSEYPLQIQAGIDSAGDAIVIWNDRVDGQPRGTSLAVLHTRTQGRSGSPLSVPARDGPPRPRHGKDDPRLGPRAFCGCLSLHYRRKEAK